MSNATVIAFPRKQPVIGYNPNVVPPHQQADIAAALATGFRSMHESRDFALSMGILDALEAFAKETLQMIEVFRKSART